MPCHLYLVGEDAATSRILDLDPKWSFEDVQRAAGAAFHVAQPTGKLLLVLDLLLCTGLIEYAFRFTPPRTEPSHQLATSAPRPSP